MIHRNLSIEDQAGEVDKVKRSESGIIVDPVLRPEHPVKEALAIMARYRISGVPITDENRKLVGILTNRDLVFEENLDQPIRNVMTSENLVTAPVGTTLEEAKRILHQHQIEKLPLVDDEFHLKGLITIKDIEKASKYPNAAKDEKGRLRVAAAVGTGPDTFEASGRPGRSRRGRLGGGYGPRTFRDACWNAGLAQKRVRRQGGHHRGQRRHRRRAPGP